MFVCPTLVFVQESDPSSWSSSMATLTWKSGRSWRIQRGDFSYSKQVDTTCCKDTPGLNDFQCSGQHMLGDTRETIWRSLSREEDPPSRGPLFFSRLSFTDFPSKILTRRMGVPEPRRQSVVPISPEGMNLLWFMHVTSTKVGGSLVQLSMCRSPWRPRGTESARHAMMAV